MIKYGDYYSYSIEILANLPKPYKLYIPSYAAGYIIYSLNGTKIYHSNIIKDKFTAEQAAKNHIEQLDRGEYYVDL